eukprot:gene28695-37683_t
MEGWVLIEALLQLQELQLDSQLQIVRKDSALLLVHGLISLPLITPRMQTLQSVQIWDSVIDRLEYAVVEKDLVVQLAI